MIADSKRHQLLQWISVQGYMAHHEEHKNAVLQGTGEWLLMDPVLRKWRNESVSSIFWLHGMLGSGKSKLV
jgi:hypothetical protein